MGEVGVTGGLQRERGTAGAQGITRGGSVVVAVSVSADSRNWPLRPRWPLLRNLARNWGPQ